MTDPKKTIESTLVDARNKQYENKVRALKAKAEADRKLAMENEMAELIKGRKIPYGERGQEIELWQKVDMDADRAIHADQNAFNDWRSNMNALLQMYVTLFDAMLQSRKEVFLQVEQAITEPVYNYWQGIKQKLGFSSVYDIPKEMSLPKLTHLVQFTDANELKVDSLHPSDGIELNYVDEFGNNVDVTGQLDNSFKEGVNAWLKEQGYVPDAVNAKKFVRADNPAVELTKKDFDKLKTDQATGLNAYLTKDTNVTYEERKPFRP
jgi:hypothetical protein